MTTYFISGHRDITNKEFKRFYEKDITNAVLAEPDAHFVVGDYYGVDEMAQEKLASLQKKFPDIKITVYHMFTDARNNPCNLPTKGGFVSDHDRDSTMTNVSDKDIAWVRSGKDQSGTAQNLLRRKVKELVHSMKFVEANDFLNGLISTINEHQENDSGIPEIYYPGST